MALSDVPKFQAAVSEDAALQEDLKSVISGITEGIGMPLSAASDVDWSPLIDFAKKLGFEFSVEEIKEAIFGGGRELSEEDLDAAVGAGGLFSLASLGQFDNSISMVSISGTLRDDTIHGFNAAAGGLGDDTIHGKK